MRHAHAWQQPRPLSGSYASSACYLMDPVLLHRYQRFLDSVLEAMEEFHEVADLMARHATLAATQEDLKQQQQLAADLAEQSRCTLISKASSNVAICNKALKIVQSGQPARS